MLINCNNIETIKLFNETESNRFKWTSVLHWETNFLGRNCSINVDLKWYDENDFQTSGILESNKKKLAKEIEQYSTDEELLTAIGTEKYRIKDKKLMLNPHIVITFISGQKQKKFFDTFKEAQDFAEFINNKLQDILIEL